MFAPEASIAFFGGDPDNFMFPRYNLDVSFLRIYGRDGKLLPMQHSLGWSRAPLSEDELTFVAGNPGGTSRLMTVSQLEDNRDVRLPAAIAGASRRFAAGRASTSRAAPSRSGTPTICSSGSRTA